MTNHFYRKTARRAITTIATLVVAATACVAQYAGPTTSSTRKAHRGPRALAVLEFLPNGQVRLVPVALWIDGRYYDASLYAANPEPMAVEPETVYEAQSFGEPTGIFTVTAPRQVNGNWIADGTWKPHLAVDDQVAAQAKKAAAEKAKEPPAKTVFTGDGDDSRPVLKRAPGSAGDSASGAQAPQPSSSTGNSNSGDSDRPVMKRAPSESSSKPSIGTPDQPAGTTASSSNSPADADNNDPNRPVMHRASNSSSSSASPTSGSTPVAQSAAASDDNDPNRPTLSRDKPHQPQPIADLPSPATSAPIAPGAKNTKSYPAISDASSYQGRPLLYSMSPGELKAQQELVANLAMSEIRTFAAKHHGPAIPKTTTLTDYDARSFDLDYSSSPTIVLTAKLPVTAAAKGTAPANLTYFATVVAKIDINGQPQKIFSMVTDNHHLDAYPRMELIDAVDADANGRGDLLFREYYDVGIKYTLYRVTSYQLEQIFEGGSSL